MKLAIIFFDYGNVSCKDPTILLRQYLSEKLVMPEQKVSQILSEECIYLDIDAITEQAFWKKVIKKAGYKGSHKEFTTTIQDIYCPNIAPDERILKVVERIRQKGIRTGILSNIIYELGNHCRNKGYYNAFSPIILSGETRIRKPDQRIFQYATEEANVKPEETALIDDKTRNAEAAIKCGWKAEQFDLRTQTPQELETILDRMIS